MSQRRYVRCDALVAAGRECCSSCHDDIDEGYDELMECEGPGGLVALTCCGRGVDPTPEQWAAIAAELERTTQPGVDSHEEP
jgi:hypothetical protein